MFAFFCWSIWVTYGSVIVFVQPTGRFVVRLSVSLAWQKHWRWTLCAQVLKFWHTCRTCDTIDMFYFIPVLVTLTLTEGHEVSAKQNVLDYCFHTLFKWRGWNVMCWSNLSGMSWYYSTVTFMYTQKITAVYWLRAKKKMTLVCSRM